MVMRRACGFTCFGVVLGLDLSMVISRMLATLLYDVKPFDLDTLMAVSLLVLMTSAAAAYIPARRAWSVDPLAVTSPRTARGS